MLRKKADGKKHWYLQSAAFKGHLFASDLKWWVLHLQLLNCPVCKSSSITISRRICIFLGCLSPFGGFPGFISPSLSFLLILIFNIYLVGLFLDLRASISEEGKNFQLGEP